MKGEPIRTFTRDDVGRWIGVVGIDGQARRPGTLVALTTTHATLRRDDGSMIDLRCHGEEWSNGNGSRFTLFFV